MIILIWRDGRRIIRGTAVIVRAIIRFRVGWLIRSRWRRDDDGRHGATHKPAGRSPKPFLSGCVSNRPLRLEVRLGEKDSQRDNEDGRINQSLISLREILY